MHAWFRQNIFLRGTKWFEQWSPNLWLLFLQCDANSKAASPQTLEIFVTNVTYYHLLLVLCICYSFSMGVWRKYTQQFTFVEEKQIGAAKQQVNSPFTVEKVEKIFFLGQNLSSQCISWPVWWQTNDLFRVDKKVHPKNHTDDKLSSEIQIPIFHFNLSIGYLI